MVTSLHGSTLSPLSQFVTMVLDPEGTCLANDVHFVRVLSWGLYPRCEIVARMVLLIQVNSAEKSISAVQVFRGAAHTPLTTPNVKVTLRVDRKVRK